MLKKHRILLLLGATLLAVFVVGVVHLLQLRFSAGDVYPPYSTLRADPVGSRAFFESLNSLPALRVERFFDEDTSRIGDGRDSALLALGFSPSGGLVSDEAEARELEKFMNQGGRIVFSFRPVQERPFRLRLEEQLEKAESEKGEKEKPDDKTFPAPPKKRYRLKRLDEDGHSPRHPVELCERWKVTLAFHTAATGDARRAVDAVALPEQVSHHTALYFDKLGPDWRTIYQWGGRAVLIERTFGGGSLVLAADSYFLSNEALRQERHANLLTWLVGPAHRVIFDETHLGVAEHPGLATLIRKYRLHALVAAFILLAVLFVWRNTASFVPAYEEDAALRAEEVVAGRDSAAGFVNLLRRNIRPRELLRVCFNEWARSCIHNRADLQARAQRMEAVLQQDEARPAAEQNATATYREMSRILTVKH